MCYMWVLSREVEQKKEKGFETISSFGTSRSKKSLTIGKFPPSALLSKFMFQFFVLLFSAFVRVFSTSTGFPSFIIHFWRAWSVCSIVESESWTKRKNSLIAKTTIKHLKQNLIISTTVRRWNEVNWIGWQSAASYKVAGATDWSNFVVVRFLFLAHSAALEFCRRNCFRFILCNIKFACTSKWRGWTSTVM